MPVRSAPTLLAIKLVVWPKIRVANRDKLAILEHLRDVTLNYGALAPLPLVPRCHGGYQNDHAVHPNSLNHPTCRSVDNRGDKEG